MNVVVDISRDSRPRTEDWRPRTEDRRPESRAPPVAEGARSRLEAEFRREPDHQRCRDGQRLLEDTGMTFDASPRNCVRNPLDTLQNGLPKLMFDVRSPAEPAMTA